MHNRVTRTFLRKSFLIYRHKVSYQQIYVLFNIFCYRFVSFDMHYLNTKASKISVWMRYFMKRDNLKDLGLAGRILQRILNKLSWKMQTGLTWLSVNNPHFLWWWWNFGFRSGILSPSLQAAQQNQPRMSSTFDNYGITDASLIRFSKFSYIFKHTQTNVIPVYLIFYHFLQL
jgi:hypothetical protein